MAGYYSVPYELITARSSSSSTTGGSTSRSSRNDRRPCHHYRNHHHYGSSPQPSRKTRVVYRAWSADPAPRLPPERMFVTMHPSTKLPPAGKLNGLPPYSGPGHYKSCWSECNLGSHFRRPEHPAVREHMARSRANQAAAVAAVRSGQRFPTLLQTTQAQLQNSGHFGSSLQNWTGDYGGYGYGVPAGWRRVRMRESFDPHYPYGAKPVMRITPRTAAAHDISTNWLASGGMNTTAKLDHFTEHTAEPMRDVATLGLRSGSAPPGNRMRA